jgi:hypothetical protein
MGWIVTARTELIGLFVDDGSVAAAILVWLAIGGICLHVFDIPPVVEGALLATGFALLLAENVARTARETARRAG